MMATILGVLEESAGSYRGNESEFESREFQYM